MDQQRQSVSHRTKVIVLILIAVWVLISAGITLLHSIAVGDHPRDETLRPAILVLGFFWLYGLVVAWFIHHGKIINVHKIKRFGRLLSSPEAWLLFWEYTLLVGPVVYAGLLYELGLPGWLASAMKVVAGAIGIAWGLNNLKAGAAGGLGVR